MVPKFTCNTNTLDYLKVIKKKQNGRLAMPNIKTYFKAVIVELWYRNYFTDKWNRTNIHETELV